MSLALGTLAATRGRARRARWRTSARARRTALRLGAAADARLRGARWRPSLRAEDEPGRARPLAAEALARGEELGLDGAHRARRGRSSTGWTRRSSPAPRFARQGREAVAAPRGRRLGDRYDGRAVPPARREGHRAPRPAAGAPRGGAPRARPRRPRRGRHGPPRDRRRASPGSCRSAPAARRTSGPTLDAEAKRPLPRRAVELRDELEEAESFNDPERAARAREELAWIAEQLTGAVGLGGRDRRTGSDAERARVNVTRAIRARAAARRRARRGARSPPAGRPCARARSAPTSRTPPSRSPGRSTHSGALRRGRRRQRVRWIGDAPRGSRRRGAASSCSSGARRSRPAASRGRRGRSGARSGIRARACHGLYDVWSFHRLDSIVSSGLGGGSLIYANVILRRPESWFADQGDERWPIGPADLERALRGGRGELGATRVPVGRQHAQDPPLPRGGRRDRPGLAGGRTSPSASRSRPAPSPSPASRSPAGARCTALQRSTCRRCGECDVGCNFGAKNTLDFTYLTRGPAAPARTSACSATSSRSSRGGGDGSAGWTVRYRRARRRRAPATSPSPDEGAVPARGRGRPRDPRRRHVRHPAAPAPQRQPPRRA